LPENTQKIPAAPFPRAENRFLCTSYKRKTPVFRNFVMNFPKVFIDIRAVPPYNKHIFSL